MKETEMRFIRTKAAIAGIGLAISLAACGDAGNDDDGGRDVEAEENAADQFDDGTKMKELAEAGKIVVGVKYDQPGLGFKDAASDIPTGFDIEIAKILIADLGIDPASDNVEWKETISDNREPFLIAGEVDLVLASYSINDERRASVGQAGPYMVTGQQLLVKKGSGISSVDDLQGKAVCSVTGSTSLDNAEAAGMKPRGFDTYSECRDQVLDGAIDAMTTDGTILLGFAALNPDELEVVGDTFSTERIGVGFSKDSPEMCDWINGVLEEAYANGDWAEAFEVTLGKSGADTPEPPAVDAGCA
jgi:glutamate transport system substrate-binding protein